MHFGHKRFGWNVQGLSIERATMTVDEIEKEIKALSANDRKDLFARLGVVDPINPLCGDVRIDDWVGEDQLRPRSTIIYPDGLEESIDIIASVESNPVSIGHPAILLAIKRWEHIVLYRHAQSRSPVYQSTKPDFVELAQMHLERVGSALLKGAKDRALPKEEALDVYIQKLGLDTDYYYLHFAWQLLDADEIKKARRLELRLKLLEDQLSNFPALLCRLGDLRYRGHNYPLPRIRVSSFEFEQMLFSLIQYDVPDKLTHWAVHCEPERFFGEAGLNNHPVSASIWINDLGHTTWDGYYHIEANGKSVPIKVSDAIKKMGLYNTRIRKLLVAVKGIIGLAEEIPGGDMLNGYKTDVIIEFLKSKDGKACVKKRPSWPVMVSRFDSWRFPLDKATLRKYRSKAKQERLNKREDRYIPYFPDYTAEIGLAGLNAIPPRFFSMGWEYPQIDGRFLLPDWFNDYDSTEIGHHWHSLPIVTVARKPIMASCFTPVEKGQSVNDTDRNISDM